MQTTYATLALKEEGAHVLVVTLNRPEVLNAISTQMGRDWLDLFNGLAADPGEVRCVVLTVFHSPFTRVRNDTCGTLCPSRLGNIYRFLIDD